MDVSQYLEIFIDETSEHLQNLSDCIMGLKKIWRTWTRSMRFSSVQYTLKGMAEPWALRECSA